MHKIQLTILLIAFFFICNSQEEKILDLNHLSLLKLSQITETITAIKLNKATDGTQFIYINEKYIYICGISKVSQFDHNGSLIKSIGGNGFICGITGSIQKNEIYVAYDKQIKCYTNSLQEKYAYNVTPKILSILYHNNKLWIQSYYLKDSIVHHNISKLELSSGKETILPFEYKELLPNNVGAISNATFSTYNGDVVWSINTDTVLYEIKNGKISTFSNWKIKENIHKIEDNAKISPFINKDIQQSNILSYYRHILDRKIIIGKYLFLEFHITDKYDNRTPFLYVEDLKTGISHVIKKLNKDELPIGIYDDINNTGYITFLLPTNLNDCFCYKNGDNIYIVKTKP